jgi:hypothetical protein
MSDGALFALVLAIGAVLSSIDPYKDQKLGGVARTRWKRCGER